MTTTRSRPAALLWLPLALLALVALGLTSCGGDDDDGGDAGTAAGSDTECEPLAAGGDDGDGDAADVSGGDGGGQAIVLAPQDFAESVTLTEAYGQYLEANNYDVTIQRPSGFREIVYPALESGDADIVIDYTGSAATFLDETGEPSPDSDETYDRLTEALSDDLTAAAYSPSEDANALVVLCSFAVDNDLTAISDLESVQDEITFGGSAQCIEREDCLLGYQSDEFYGLSFADVRTLDYGPPLAAGLQSGDIQAAQYQTTAPEIASGDFVVLEDDLGLLSADNIVPIVRSEVADDELIGLLDELSAVLTTDDLIGWNEATDIGNEESVDVATDWLEDNGLL
jgi:osmoprotectant transport system substrate-binding protein